MTSRSTCKPISSARAVAKYDWLFVLQSFKSIIQAGHILRLELSSRLARSWPRKLHTCMNGAERTQGDQCASLHWQYSCVVQQSSEYQGHASVTKIPTLLNYYILIEHTNISVQAKGGRNQARVHKAVSLIWLTEKRSKNAEVNHGKHTGREQEKACTAETHEYSYLVNPEKEPYWNNQQTMQTSVNSKMKFRLVLHSKL